MAVDIPEEWKEQVRKLFPSLREGVSLEFTSEIDFNYNCLAWALGCNTHLFANYKGAFWEWPDIPDNTLEGWARLCEVHGFVRTPSADFQPGYEKIALFHIIENDENWLHAARSDSGGRWKSKLGDWGPDIDHDGLSALEDAYGAVAIVLEKHRPDWGK